MWFNKVIPTLYILVNFFLRTLSFNQSGVFTVCGNKLTSWSWRLHATHFGKTLTHFSTMLNFHTRWKRQKIKGGGWGGLAETEYWAKMDYIKTVVMGFVSLTLPVLCILESCIKIKINFFQTSLWCLRFHEGL